MSLWLAIAIGCTFNIKNKSELLYCEADSPKLYLTNGICEIQKKGSQKCIEFKKGDYLIKYEGKK